MQQKSTPSFFLGNLRKLPSHYSSPNPNSQFRLSKSNQTTFGEAVEELQCFWYVSFQLPEQNPDQDDSSDDEPINSADEIWGRPIRIDWEFRLFI